MSYKISGSILTFVELLLTVNLKIDIGNSWNTYIYIYIYVLFPTLFLMFIHLKTDIGNLVRDDYFVEGC
jgi:hypothetical protein